MTTKTTSFILTLAAGLILSASAVAQTASVPETSAAASPTVTISIADRGVRFVALGSFRQMRLEVFSTDGVSLYNSDFHAGGVRDWALDNKEGQRLADGTYQCVITIRDLGGKLITKQGSVLVQSGMPSLQMSEGEPAGNIEKSLAPVSDSANAAVALVTHDGNNGQVVSTRGGFVFRAGDFFGGRDSELMRLTPVNSGSDSKSRARLDVFGSIRPTDGIEFADGTVQTTALGGRKDANGITAPDVAGTGTQNKLAKWVDNSATLGDSLLSESGQIVQVNGNGLQMTAAPSGAIDTNILYLSNTNGTTGVLAGNVPNFGAANGPFFAMRGNTYSAIPNQRGLFTIGAGNVSSPVGDEGSVKFNTGNDQLRMVIKPGGNVGVGVSNPQALLDVGGDLKVSGNATVTGNIAAKYQDIAEWTPARSNLPAGTVVSLDPLKSNTVMAANRRYDTHVAGVVSAQPGVVLGEPGPNKVLVATTGRVKVKVDARRHPIHIGDLLVASNIPGVAMKSQPFMVRGRLMHRPGTIIGKALESLPNGRGEISVLLSLQ